jgi:hypothetical protein
LIDTPSEEYSNAHEGEESVEASHLPRILSTLRKALKRRVLFYHFQLFSSTIKAKMLDYSNDLPPSDYLILIADHCPNAMSTYLMIWRDQDQNGTVKYPKHVIEDIKCLSWCKFKRDLRHLAYEGVIDRHDEGESVTVTLAEWVDDE